MVNLDTIEQIDGEMEDKYIKDTAYEQQDNAVGGTFEWGTIKITDEYAKQAKIAMMTRVEGTKDYTEKRVARIDLNHKLAQSSELIKGAVHKVFIPATFNASHDWQDDLYEIFSNMIDSLTVDAKKNVADRHLVKKLRADESEDLKHEGMIRSLLNTVVDDAIAQFQEAGDQQSIDALKVLQEENRYYFKCLDTIKTMLKDGLKAADYQRKLDDFHRFGVDGGMFMVKKKYEAKTTKALRVYKDAEKKNGQYFKFGNFTQEYEQEDIFNFDVIDTRRIIHRKDKIEWIIEKINTNFWSLLNRTLDGDGKPKENATYDNSMLEQLKDKAFKAEAPECETENEEEEKTIGDDDVKKIDGDILIYEGHNLPFRYKIKDLVNRNGGEKYKGKDGESEITLPSIITCAILDDTYYPIRIQPSPWGLPYEWEVFCHKEGDVAGMGLSEVIEVMQTLLNELINLGFDLLDMALKGISAVNADKLKDPSQMEKLGPGAVIELKDANGMNLNEIIQFFRPPLESLPVMSQLLNYIEQTISKTSRSGPNGSKVAPNPSATEYAKMMSEMEKSTNRCALRLSGMWVRVITDMYIYLLMNKKGKFNLKLVGYKLSEQDFVGVQSQQELMAKIKQVSKWVELEPQDLYVDGISFEIKALENAKKAAVQKQQQMQFVELIKKFGLSNNQDGSPVIYKDDTDNPVIIDMYKIVDSTAKSMDQENIWKPAPQGGPPGMPPIPGMPAGSPQGGPPALPPMGSMPSEGNLTGAANTVQ